MIEEGGTRNRGRGYVKKTTARWRESEALKSLEGKKKKKKYRNEIWRDKGRKYALEKEKGIKIEKNTLM